MAELTKWHQVHYGEFYAPIKPDPRRCAYQEITGGVAHQCFSLRGHGPNDAFCKEHAGIYEYQEWWDRVTKHEGDGG